MFANSSFETATDTEKAFNKAFVAQLGNIALIVMLVVGAAFVTILMIVGNTMALTIRERTREIGVLKTLGFSGRRILGMVLGESVLLALLGGIPGLALAALIAFLLRESLSNFMPGFAVTPGIALIGVALMLALGDRHRDHPGAQCHAAEDRRRARPGLTHALAAPAGRRRHDDQPEEHLAAPLAVALDRRRGRARRHRAAGVPRHGERLPAHARRAPAPTTSRSSCAAARRPRSTARSRATRCG